MLVYTNGLFDTVHKIQIIVSIILIVVLSILARKIDFKILEQALNLLLKNNDSLRLKLVKKANTLLDNLEEIRQEIIFGSVSKDKLIEISRLVKQKDVETNDEKLKEILAEIELRVEVELAKLVR